MSTNSTRYTIKTLYTVAYKTVCLLARRRQGDRKESSTELAHEAYLRLIKTYPTHRLTKSKWLSIIATVMKRYLIDAARRRNAQIRSGRRCRVALEEAIQAPSVPPDGELISECLEKLATQFPGAVRAFKLRYLERLSVEETANALGLSIKQVRNRCDFVLYEIVAAFHS